MNKIKSIIILLTLNLKFLFLEKGAFTTTEKAKLQIQQEGIIFLGEHIKLLLDIMNSLEKAINDSATKTNKQKQAFLKEIEEIKNKNKIISATQDKLVHEKEAIRLNTDGLLTEIETFLTEFEENRNEPDLNVKNLLQEAESTVGSLQNIQLTMISSIKFITSELEKIEKLLPKSQRTDLENLDSLEKNILLLEDLIKALIKESSKENISVETLTIINKKITLLFILVEQIDRIVANLNLHTEAPNIEPLATAISVLEEMILDLVAKDKDLLSRIEELKKNNDNFITQLKEIPKIKQELDLANSQLQKTNNEKQLLLEETNKDKNLLQQQNKELADLKLSSKKLEEAALSKEETIKNNAKEISDQKKLLDDFKNKIDDLTASLEKKQSEITDQSLNQEDLAALQELAESITSAQEQINKQLDEQLFPTQKSISDQLEQIQQELQQALEELELLKNKNLSLQDELANKDNEIRMEKNKAQINKEEEVKTLQNNILQAQKERDAAQSQLQQMSITLNESSRKAQISDLQGQQMYQQIMAQQAQIAQLSTAAQSYMMQIQNLQQQLQAYWVFMQQRNMPQQDPEAARLMDKISNMKDEQAKMEKSLAEKQQELNDKIRDQSYQSKIDQLQNKLDLQISLGNNRNNPIVVSSGTQNSINDDNDDFWQRYKDRVMQLGNTVSDVKQSAQENERRLKQLQNSVTSFSS